MLGLSFGEILFLAVLALVVIGPKQLPEVARTIGRFINEMKRSTSVLSAELKRDIKTEIKLDMPDLKDLAAQRLMENKAPSSGVAPASASTTTENTSGEPKS